MSRAGGKQQTEIKPSVKKRICTAIELGATNVLAARAGGISEATFYRWLHEYPDFAQAVEDAEGAGAVRWLAVIEQAALSGNWPAAAWKLERRYPEIYGRSVQENRNFDFSKASDAELEAIVQGSSPGRAGVAPAPARSADADESGSTGA